MAGEMKKSWKRSSTALTGPARNENTGYQKQKTQAPSRAPKDCPTSKKKEEEEYLLVDGYNIIFAWEELKIVLNQYPGGKRQADGYSEQLSGIQKADSDLVFDAYKVEGHPGEVQKYHNIYVVYTKEAETADQYIEKTVHKIGRTHQVTVATSDGLEQIIIMGAGGQKAFCQRG